MKKTYRIISIAILICFIFNNFSFAADINLPVTSQTNINKLATPSRCDDLMGIEHKDIGRIKFALMMYLKYSLPRYTESEILEDSDLDRLSELRLTEDTIFSPLGMHFFFNERTPLPNGYISVMCRIKDKKYRSDIKTYHIVFSPKRNKKGIFPIIEIYTEKEYDKLKDLIEKHGKFPLRELEKPEDAKTIERYIQHEKIIDRWIRKKMRDKDNYIEIGPDYVEAFSYILYGGANYFRELNEALHSKLENILEEIFENRKLVLIKVKDGEKLPVIYEDGKETDVGAHTSQNAMYIFVNENSGRESSFENFRNYLNGERIIAGDGTIFDGLAALIVASHTIGQEVVPKLMHEIGVMCGLDYKVEGRRAINDMDRLYKEADKLYAEISNELFSDEIGRIPLVRELEEKLSLVNLDYLRGMPEKRYERDYALMIRHPDDEDEGLPPEKLPFISIEKGIRRINKIWGTVSEGKIIGDPFSEKAQNAFKEIIIVFHRIKGLGTIGDTLIKDLYYKAQTAYLLGDDNYKIVIDFFKEIKVSPVSELRKQILGDKNFLMLYFMARMMDRRSVIEASSSEEPFMMFYAKELFGDEFDRKTIFGGRLRSDELNFSRSIIHNIIQFIHAYREKKEYKKALKLVHNCIHYFTHMRTLPSYKIFISEIDILKKSFTELKDKITAERAALIGDSTVVGLHIDGLIEMPQDVKEKINAACDSAGDKIGDPFSDEAQQAFARILRVFNSEKLKEPIMKAEADIYYKICTAALFGEGDYENVIKFFKNVRDLPKEFEDFSKKVLGDISFLTLYFIACRLDLKTIEEAAEKQIKFYEYSSGKLFFIEDELIKKEVFKTQYSEEDFDENIFASIRGKVFASIRGLVNLFKSRGNYSKALEIVKKNIFFFESQSNFNPAFKKAIEMGGLSYWYTEMDIIQALIDSSDTKDEEGPESPVAGVNPSLMGNTRLIDLAPHPLVNALIGTMLEYAKSSKTDNDMDKFIQHEGKKKSGIYWFGYDDEKNESFLDIFNKLTQIRAGRHERNIPVLEDEIELVKELVEKAGLQDRIVEVDSEFVTELKMRLSFQIEHFSVRKGTIYAMRKYRKKYKKQIMRHAMLERNIHEMAINDVLINGDINTYLLWRNNKIQRITIDIEVPFPGIIIPIKDTMSYNEFAQVAHEIAEDRYPVGEERPTMAGRNNNVHTRLAIEGVDVPTAGINSEASNSGPDKSLEERKQLAIEELSVSFTAAELRWLYKLMKEKYPTHVEWETAPLEEKKDDRLRRFGEILKDNNIWRIIPYALPSGEEIGNIGPKLVEEAIALRERRIEDSLDKILGPSLSLGQKEEVAEELAKYGQDALVALSLRWYEVKEDPDRLHDYRAIMLEVITNLVMKKLKINDYAYAKVLTRDILQAFDPHVRYKSLSLDSAGQCLAKLIDASKALEVLLELVPVELGAKASESTQDIWDELNIRVKLKALLGIVKGLPELAEKEITSKMEPVAEDVGIEIAPPVSRYNLFVPYNFYETDEEYEDDSREYGDRFGLVKIGTDRIKAIVPWVLKFIERENLEPKHVVVQLPRPFADKAQLDELTEIGIKFVIVNTKGMNRAIEKKRKEYRDNILQIMRLVRNINEDTPKDSKLYRLLRFYIEGHLLIRGGKAGSVGEYMEAIMQNDVTRLLKYILSYKPIEQFEWRDYKLITETLRSA